jgi:hypothetical protein
MQSFKRTKDGALLHALSGAMFAVPSHESKVLPISAHKHRHSNKTTVHQETFIHEISAEEF